MQCLPLDGDPPHTRSLLGERGLFQAPEPGGVTAGRRGGKPRAPEAGTGEVTCKVRQEGAAGPRLRGQSGPVSTAMNEFPRSRFFMDPSV